MKSQDSTFFDVAIIGGGINGAGIARDASMRGLKVVVLEKSDFGSGTTSRSSKLVHGGLRYLEHGHIMLVFESLRERYILRQIAPSLVQPLPFILPFYKNGGRNKWIIKTGIYLYHLLALFRDVGRYKFLSSKEVIKETPFLSKDGLNGGALYWDCQVDDVNLCKANIVSAGKYGAKALNYACVTGIHKENNKFRLTCKDIRKGRKLGIEAKIVINASGPWADEVRDLLEPSHKRVLRLTKGAHILLREKVSDKALLLFAKKDGRVFFILPWKNKTMVGTTDTDYKGSPDKVKPSEEDIDYLLSEAQSALPGMKITHSSIINTSAGLRPLVGSGKAHASSESREYKIVESPKNFLTIYGGKLTTYRSLAEKVTDRIFTILGKKSPSCKTWKLSLSL